MSTRHRNTRGNPARARVGVLHGEGIHFPAERARPGLLDPPPPGKHLWMVAVTHVVSDESAALAHSGGGRVNLDAETVAAITTGCYVCEQPYTPGLAAEKCKGEPAP